MTDRLPGPPGTPSAGSRADESVRGVTVAELLARNPHPARRGAGQAARHQLAAQPGTPVQTRTPAQPRTPAQTRAPASPRPPAPTRAPAPQRRPASPVVPPPPVVGEDDELELRRRKIDESLTRLTAAHAGLGRERRGDQEEERHATRLRRHRLGRVLAVVAAGLVFLASGTGWGVKSWVDGKVRQVAALDPGSEAIRNAAAQRGDQNFLLVGSDSRAGAQPADDAGSPDQIPGARSDTIMVAHIPADRSRVVVVSFPRDLEITRPPCEGWDAATGRYTGQELPAAPEMKINTAFEVGGPRCVTKVVQQLSGLAINHFVGIDFQGFKAMVDAVNGVKICVEHPVRDDVLGTIIDHSGTTTLTGEQALAFVRARHVVDDPTSDYGRIQRQQRFLASLLRTALSSKVLLDPGRLRGFLSALASSTFGENIGVDQLLPLAQSLQRLDASHVTFVTLPTTGEANARGNEVLRPAENQALFTAIIDGTPLPGETSAPTRAASPAPQTPSPPTSAAPAANSAPSVPSASALPLPAATSALPVRSVPGLALPTTTAVPSALPAPVSGLPPQPSQVKLQVLNATSTPGAASALSAALTRLGFNVVTVGNSPAPAGHTVVRYAADRAAQARTLGAAVPSATLERDDSMPGTVTLVIGSDFDGVVKALPASASPSSTAVPSDLATVNGGDTSCR